MDHAAQAAGAGHVDAVVIARRQVQRGELAVLEARGQGFVAAHQGPGGVRMALGLEHLVAGDGAELADGAVHRADEGCVGQRPRIRAQRAGEEGVEAGVGLGPRVGRLGHVHAVAGDEAADQDLREGAAFQASE